MPLLFQTQGLRSLCQFSFLKRILPLDSSLFRSWRFLLWSCLVDFIMGKRRPFRWKTWELQLIQLGQLRNIKLAAQLDKEGRFNGSVWSSVSREKILGRGLCRCATYLKPNHQIGTGFNHLNHWKDYFEGEHLQSAYLLDLSVTTRITPFLGFGIPTCWGWHCQAHHENTRLWRIDDRLCGYAGAILVVKISDTLGHWECWVSKFCCDFMGHWDSNEKTWCGTDLSTKVHPGVRHIEKQNEPLESPVLLFWHCCKIFQVRQCLWTGGFFLTLDLYKGWVGDPLRSLEDAVLLFSNMKFRMAI